MLYDRGAPRFFLWGSSSWELRTFLTQSDLSVENGHFRLLKEAQIGLSLHSRKKAFSIQVFSPKFSREIQSKNLTFSAGSSSRKTQSKKFCTCFFNPSHCSSHHKTHTHTPTHSYQVPHSSIIQHRRRCLGYHCCCFLPQVCVAHSQLRSPASVYHTTAATARDTDAMLPTTATPAVALAALGWVQRHERSFGGFWLSPTPPTRLDEGSSRVKHALLAKSARSTELPTDFRLPYIYSSTPSHQPPLGRAQKPLNRLDWR